MELCRTVWNRVLAELTLGRIRYSSHEDETVCTVLVDEEEERSIHHETRLYRQRRETQLSDGGGFSSLLVHRDATLVLKLRTEMKTQN